MGGRMVERLMTKGHSLTGYNRTKEKAQPLIDRGMRWADTPRAVAQASDVVITMGCGDACPFFPGKRYEDWKLDDPAGQGIEAVRPIRDEIRSRIEKLVGELV